MLFSVEMNAERSEIFHKKSKTTHWVMTNSKLSAWTMVHFNRKKKNDRKEDKIAIGRMNYLNVAVPSSTTLSRFHLTYMCKHINSFWMANVCKLFNLRLAMYYMRIVQCILYVLKWRVSSMACHIISSFHLKYSFTRSVCATELVCIHLLSLSRISFDRPLAYSLAGWLFG